MTVGPTARRESDFIFANERDHLSGYEQVEAKYYLTIHGFVAVTITPLSDSE
jgi:hypothetical protein